MSSTKTSKVKIKSPAVLQKLFAGFRRKGLKVVFTNGCFDLLHEGHVAYLEHAKSLGDVLVIAMDTDAAVRKLKGADRPINNLRSRQRVMAGLGCVDFVTSFAKGDPRPLILKLKPHVLVKGGDWSLEKIRGASEVLGWGGRVYSLPYIKGRSTTKIIEKIQQR